MKRPPIYFLRHGETDWNAAGRLQGRFDIPLNAKGRTQALRNGGVLAEILPEPTALAYVASPLTRTRQTMEIARGALGLPQDAFATDDRLIEISFGDWEGRSWAEIKRDDPENWHQRRLDAYDHVVPGGESYANVMTRVVAWLNSVAQPSVIVSHGGVMRCLRGHILGLEPKKIVDLDVPQDKVMLIEDDSITFI